jgi:peptidoglycan hydrolase-like protein with peptidoglycan-binding domain
MKAFQRVLASLSVLGALAVSMVALSSPAAALPSCNTSTEFGNPSYYWYWPTANGNANCVMGRGNQSAGVSTLQGALNRCYGQGLVVDGIYGAATEQAVRNVQGRIGAGVDGVYGPQTRSRMAWFTYPAGVCAGHG